MSENYISAYITTISERFKRGTATEHSYRGDLQKLIEQLVKGVTATNEPKRIACGAPDYIITKNDIPVGYIEAKDIGVDLKSKTLKEQFERYRASLDNLIFTDYIDFHLYINGEFKTSVKIAEIEGGKIVPIPENFVTFENLIKDFCIHIGQTIKSSKKLAEMMAGKARMLAEVIEKALLEDEADNLNPDTALQSQLHAFKDILIHDIKAGEFADIYAQTIAYGMFAARLHDPTLPTFSRQEAAELIPKTNPFLRKLFQYIAGYDLDGRIVWIVDGLADLFRATDIAALLKNFGKSTQTNDPIIHFYETFLSEYDPKLRKARGVWYTPEPVVNFIVRAVDDILKTEFGLKEGLADTSKTKIKVKIPTHDKRYKAGQRDYEQEVHKVQILDPATGTGTFLAEVVKQIYKKFEGQQGIWSTYVENQLIPRLNGFELLMASYAMAHLKLDLLLTETGYKATSDQRFKIYLTNSLEEHHPDTGTLFANWLSAEANEANQIKRDTPVMVILGNPPYSGESSNKGEWIMQLMEDYKKEPGGKEKLKERNPKWINDDYVKFIRYGQHFIERNGSGILSFINPHGFLENPTFRGMRWHLLKTFDKIYTIDLHGNSNQKETSPNGSIDQNVFDIMQGVSINLFVKTGEKKSGELGKVYHFDLYGKREMKYDFLLNKSLSTIEYKEIPNKAPMYFMVQRDFDVLKDYEKGFIISELFTLNSVGVVTARDNFTLHDSKEAIQKTIEDFLTIDDETARKKFDLGKDVRDWQVNFARKDLQNHYPNKGRFIKISYRPFEYKWTYYTGKSKGFHCYPRVEVMQHFLNGENVGLVTARSNKSESCDHFFISKNIMEAKCGERTTQSAIFPLYFYPITNGQQSVEQPIEIRIPNLNKEIVNQISGNLGLKFINEKEQTKNSFAPIDILDYIYAVLHSPSYREKYKEFLKIDFPRVPYPTNINTFWQLVKLGAELRQMHLLEGETSNKYITTYPVSGNNEIIKPSYTNGKVFINETQYFDKVSQIAWEFYIAGYQPAQKWLKDRQGRILEFEDILHYQKIIVALTETDRLMKEIDTIEIG